MAFKRAQSIASSPESPLALFADLPRMPGAVPNLWGPQTAVLNEYINHHVNAKDLAIELPTGTGKTVPGLLVADWRRRKFGRQIIYACPTVQLAHQASAVARRESVPVVTLVGTAAEWPLAEVTRYDAAEAIAVTTYSAVFNAYPKLSRADTLLFDDAHAGEQYVAEAWSVSISRWHNAELYRTVLDAIRPALDGIFYQRLVEQEPDPLARRETRLVVPVRRNLVTALDAALATASGDLRWRYTMIRSGLASCLVYVAWTGILVRPLIPPTFENDLFTSAQQRLYLSATLGQAGELERAFSRSPITRLELPADAGALRNGRRFFVFPRLSPDADTQDIPREIVAKAGKALVLAPSVQRASEAANALNPDGWPVLTKDDVHTNLKAFTQPEHALLALARYDGLDLPGTHCRLVALDSKPDAAHLQERFFADRLRARVALEERVRTRVVQGAGRCTRGPSDYAIVLILDDGLTRYLSDRTTRGALAPELQAEIGFGLENSRLVATEILDNVLAFLEQGEEWRRNAEPLITAARREAAHSQVPGTEKLAGAVSDEIEACRRAWRSDWSGAGLHAEKAAYALSGSDEVRLYRALWLYFASVCFHTAAEHGESTAKTTAVGLLSQAHQASRGTTWLREVEPSDESAASGSADDTPAIRAIAARISKGIKRSSHDTAAQAVIDGLAATEPEKFEPALSELGKLLGADAYKPDKQGRCDSAWCWGERIWFVIEAKSDEVPTGVIPLRDIRQANTQLKHLASDRGLAEPPEQSVTIIVSPRTTIEPDAVTVAEPHVHLIQPTDLQTLARDMEVAWNKLITRCAGHQNDDLERLIYRVLSEHRLLPTQVRERLTTIPVGG